MSTFTAGTPDAPRPDAPPAPTPARRGRGRHFRRRDALHNYSLHFGPNMTPMVDVVMVILIFFMASAAFLGNEWFLRAAIPFESGRGKDPSKRNDPLELPPTRIDVALDTDPDGTTVVSFLGSSRVTMEQFEARIAAMKSGATSNIEVILRPTARVPYRDVVRAHAACDAVGIYKVGYGMSGAGPAAPKPAGTP
jgi:biopolymer transport protein ExbD